MSLLKSALAGVALVASGLVGSTASQAASLGGLATPPPGASTGSLVEPVHGYHRRCRWSTRWGSHRHRPARVLLCDRQPSVGFSFGYYYGPYLYWGPPIHSYRGHRRGHRIEGRHRRPGFVRIRPGRELRQYRGDRPIKRRRRSELPATYVLSNFGGITQVIGVLPTKA